MKHKKLFAVSVVAYVCVCMCVCVHVCVCKYVRMCTGAHIPFVEGKKKIACSSNRSLLKTILGTSGSCMRNKVITNPLSMCPSCRNSKPDLSTQVYKHTHLHAQKLFMRTH